MCLLHKLYNYRLHKSWLTMKPFTKTCQPQYLANRVLAGESNGVSTSSGNILSSCSDFSNFSLSVKRICKILWVLHLLLHFCCLVYLCIVLVVIGNAHVIHISVFLGHKQLTIIQEAMQNHYNGSWLFFESTATTIIIAMVTRCHFIIIINISIVRRCLNIFLHTTIHYTLY